MPPSRPEPADPCPGRVTVSVRERAQQPAAGVPGSRVPDVPGAASASGSTTGPEPTATALAIINDVVVVGETAAYSPDGTMLAFSARPADGSHGPDIYLWRLGDPSLSRDH